MNLSRGWMYNRIENGLLLPSFVEGVETFIQFATSQPRSMDGTKIKCPCTLTKCRNKAYLEPNDVRYHLVRNGFVEQYYTWLYQGESALPVDENRDVEFGETSNMRDETPNSYAAMVQDIAGPEFNMDVDDEEAPNFEAQKLYDMLKAADRELYPGCDNHSELSLVARLMSLKSENGLSDRCYDQITELINEIVPKPNSVTRNFYDSKKLMRGMGLPAEKIDCCKKGCMIYWGEDSEMTTCKFCSYPRFKRTHRGSRKNIPYKRMYYFPLTPRLQRLYASKATANEMRWHAEHETKDGVMHHPSDSPAWEDFSNKHPSFKAECRNVRLGLSTDGFQPFGQSGKQYSSWPVVLTPYNLPPGMCMKEQFMFLTVLVPGPHNPKDKLDVYLQPLIAELNQLWEVGVSTYDISKKQNFMMRAALMWTVSDFPAYEMLSGWSTAGRLACPVCMNESDAFTLRCSKKQSWFDNHRKFLPPNHSFRRNRVNFKKGKTVTKDAPVVREGSDILAELNELGLKKVTELDSETVNKSISKTCGWKKKSIFWDLPYWSTNLIRHNLDVMHIEKNMFDNVFNTLMNVEGRTKDTCKSREELNDYCHRPDLKKNVTTGDYPRACYSIDKKARQVVCDWVKGLKLPDGYASNMSRCVDEKKWKLFGMKSHDCHVFMQRLIPIAFRELLPQQVWKALTELSMFFKDLTSTTISNDEMARLESDIPIILCKLERIFPPSFFEL